MPQLQPAKTAADSSRLLSSHHPSRSMGTLRLQPPSLEKACHRHLCSTIPPYAAVACKNFARYSSACSCFGVVGGTVTASATTITIPVTVVTKTVTAGNQTSPGTPKPSSTRTSSGTPTPTCTANIKTDPLNCGKCGNVCSSGICSNGVCSSDICNAQVCGGFTNCNPKNSECFCFSSTEITVNIDTGVKENLGFCGQNAVCSGLTFCKQADDCNVKGSTGNICAVNTCCGEAGVCLVGQCGNPARKLMRMAKLEKSEGTAAF